MEKGTQKPIYRTPTWVGLVLTLVTLICLGLIVALVVVVVKYEENKPAKSEYCLTNGCARAASQIIGAVDMSVEPCNNFYDFACGSWMKTHIIPEDRSSLDIFAVVTDNVEVINKYLLEDPSTDPNAEAVQKAKDMYASCVNMGEIEARGTSVTLPLLAELGGWPVLGDKPGGHWDESKFNLTKLLITLRKYNNNPVLEMGVTVDEKNSTQHIMYLAEPDFGMSNRDYYLKDYLYYARDAYVTMATNIAIQFGADATTAAADIRDILQLETDLANITMTAAQNRDSVARYNKMTLDDLRINFTEPKPSDPIQFHWMEYAYSLFDLDGVNVIIDETEPILVRSLPYYNRLFGVLQKYPKRTIANYLVWRIMQHRSSNLPQRFRDIIHEYYKAVYGTTTATPNWRSCVNYVILQMGAAVGKLFVQEAFDDSAKDTALDMIHGIRDAFSQLIEEQDWMDGKTRQAALKKASVMREWIGYADDIIDDETLNSMYEDVEVNSTEYFQNVLGNLQRWGIGGLPLLRREYNKNGWGEPPTDVNAQYSFVLNTIEFPAGIFQPPFYRKDQPRSMNYGGIGVIIGHEITHGFDDQGRQYDLDGNLKNWWDQSIIQRFLNKSQCIVDQYGSYKIPDLPNLHIDGRLTLGENIADNGGLKESFRAYRNWVATQGHEEPMLPGLNFTNNQLFFLNFAQNWCNNKRTQSYINGLQSDPHSPGMFRVIGTLQNSKDFAREYDCPLGSFMNPRQKCSVW